MRVVFGLRRRATERERKVWRCYRDTGFNEAAVIHDTGEIDSLSLKVSREMHNAICYLALQRRGQSVVDFDGENFDSETEALLNAPSFQTHARLRLAAEALIEAIDMEDTESVGMALREIAASALRWDAALARRERLRLAVASVDDGAGATV